MGTIAATLKVATPSTANATSYASGSYTPAANRLLIAGVQASRGGSTDPPTPTLAGNGLTWALAQDPVTLALADNLFQASGTLRDRLCVFRALTGATPSIGAVTATFGATCTGCTIIVAEIDLADLTVPFVQMRMVAVGAAAATVSMDAFEDADNAVISFFAVDANATIVGEHTELADITYATPAREQMAQFLNVADTTPSATWTGANTAGGIAVELRQAAAGETVEGDVATILPALAQAAVAAVTAAGAAASVLPGLVAALTADAAVAGEAEQTLPGLEQSADGAATVSADAAQTLPPLAQDAAGTVASDVVSGTAETVLPALAQDLAAEASAAGEVAATLPGLTQEAQGALIVRGEAAGMLGQLVAAAGGTLTVRGEGGSILTALGAALTGEIPVAGAIASVLPSIVADLEGQLLGLAGPAVTERTRVTVGAAAASPGAAVGASATSVELDTGETFA